jgi:hypothetical protein
MSEVWEPMKPSGSQEVDAMWVHTTADQTPLQNAINAGSADSTLAFWIGPDEPACNTGGFVASDLQNGISYVNSHNLSGSPPIWINFAPRGPGCNNNNFAGLASWSANAGVVSMDIYPYDNPTSGSSLPDTTISSVGGYVDNLRNYVVGSGTGGRQIQPVWMVLQGFGISDDPNAGEPSGGYGSDRPPWNVTRFMAYNAIIHGARGIIYWGQFLVSSVAPLWGDLKHIATELTTVSGYLIDKGPLSLIPLSYRDVTTNATSSLEAVLFDHTSSGTRDGTMYLIVANHVNSQLSGVTITLSGLPISSAYDPLDMTSHTSIANNTWTDNFAPYQVHVYHVQ